MARRRTAAIVVVGLAFIIGGCAANRASLTWHHTSATAAVARPGATAPLDAAAPVTVPYTSPTAATRSNPPGTTPGMQNPAAPPAAAPTLPPGALPGSPPPAVAPTDREETQFGIGPSGSMMSTGYTTVALTFDDGPGPFTARVLDLLEKYGLHATFCIIGEQVADFPNEIRRMVADGDTLCNHTWDHDEDLSTRTPDQINAELQKTDDAIRAIAPNASIAYFRNPGGNFSPQTISLAAAMGMKSIYWDIDPVDWTMPGVQSIIHTVIGQTRPGSIILLHDGGGDRTQTLVALNTILPNLKARFNMVPLPLFAPPVTSQGKS